MFCSVMPQSQVVISKGKKFNALYFIREGMVGLYSSKEKLAQPFTVLKDSTMFGDYHLLYNLKSNIEFRTYAPKPH